MKLDLNLLQEKAGLRSYEDFGTGDKPSTYFTTMLAEETGEVCGAVKKLERPFTIRDFDKIVAKMKGKPGHEERAYNWDEMEDRIFIEKLRYQQLRKNLSDELSDTLTALALVANRFNIPLDEATINGFNKISSEVKSPHTL